MRNHDLRLSTGVPGIALAAFLGLSILLASCGSEKKEAPRTAVRPAGRAAPSEATPSRRAEPARVSAEEVEKEATVIVTAPVESAEAPAPPREVTYEEAEAAYFAGRYEEAADLFARYTDRKPDNPWGFYMLGLSTWKAGALDRAVEAFERALELDPDHVKSRVNLGRVHLDAGRPEAALVRADQAVAMDPDAADGHRVRGRALHRLGRTGDAIDAYRRAIRLDGNDAWSMNNLGLILIESGRFDDALLPLARAVELRDEVAVFRNNLGMALEHTGHYVAAAGAYEAAVDLDGSYGRARANFLRVRDVAEAPALEPVDLAALARAFAEEIRAWQAADRRTGPVEPARATAVVIGEADSGAVETGL